jgi:hypothetical protein
VGLLCEFTAFGVDTQLEMKNGNKMVTLAPKGKGISMGVPGMTLGMEARAPFICRKLLASSPEKARN